MLKVSAAFKIKHLEYWPGEMSCWVTAGCGEHEDLSSNHQNVLKKECKIFDQLKVLIHTCHQSHKHIIGKTCWKGISG